MAVIFLFGTVFRQRRIDLIGKPQQRDFAQRGQVAGAKVIGQRRIDPLRRIDVAVGEPAPQSLRCDVDQLDLSRFSDDLVRHGFVLFDTGDLGDDVVEALQVLDVQRRDYGDPRVEQCFDVLPPLGIDAARDVAVRIFVDQRHFRPTAQHRLDIEFREQGPAVGKVLRRNDLDALDEFGDLAAAVSLDYRRDDVGAAPQPSMRLAEHCARLTDARGGAEVDAQLAASLRWHAMGKRPVGACRWWRWRLIGGRHTNIIPPEPSGLHRILAVQLEIELQNVNHRLADEAEQTTMLVVANRVAHLGSTDSACANHPGHLDIGVRG